MRRFPYIVSVPEGVCFCRDLHESLSFASRFSHYIVFHHTIVARSMDVLLVQGVKGRKV